ncbi:MAG: cellulase family glycosylhydrolase [Polyangiaceae bacterium]
MHDLPYRFMGAVSWSVAGSGAGCRIPKPYTFESGLVESFDDLAVMRANVLKIWAFQRYAGTTGEDFSAFDRVIAEARRAGVRLVFVLENFWEDCTEGGQKNDAWFASGFRSPYGEYALSYSDYVTRVVSRYANEPTVLAWEIMHEASGTDFASLREFIASTVAQIRELDGNHLVIVGLDGGYSPATVERGRTRISKCSRITEI